MQKLKRFIVLISLALALGACGGGGGGGTPASGGGTTSATGSSDWDQLTWDQDNWK